MIPSSQIQNYSTKYALMVIVYHWSVYLYSLLFSSSCTEVIVFITALHQHEIRRCTSHPIHVLVVQHDDRGESAGPWPKRTQISRGHLNFIQSLCKLPVELIYCLCHILKTSSWGQSVFDKRLARRGPLLSCLILEVFSVSHRKHVCRAYS